MDREKNGRFVKGMIPYNKLPLGEAKQRARIARIKYYNTVVKYRNKDPEFMRKERERFRLYRKENPEKCRDAVKRWRKNPKNREKILANKRSYYHRHKKEILPKVSVYQKEIYQKVRNKRYRIDITFRLNCIMSTVVRESLMGTKNHRKWQILVGYTTKELMAHLESQFQEGMSWDNYGKWEIDHITPKSWFDFQSSNDEKFKECWALDNLQPLWMLENRSKHNKFSG